MSSEKAFQNGDIATNIIREYADIFWDYLCKIINTMFKLSIFANTLKLVDVRPLQKRGWKSLKENYRRVSVPQILSKTYGRIMFAQISAFFDDIFSK